ncbi:MAG: hypothetical protein RR147_00175 [Oscillospiraceae bacterium]
MKNFSAKRFTQILLSCVLLTALLCGTALADVLWEPVDDFYASHSEECKPLVRSFYANGKTGFLEFFTKPNGDSLGFSNNGEKYTVMFTYTDDKNAEWGIVQFSKNASGIVSLLENDENVKNGWVKMDGLLNLYDYVAFDADHGNEYGYYEGDYSELKGVTDIVLWTYPRSGEIVGSLAEIGDGFALETTYTDSQGLVWGFVNYAFGHKNVWVCLSEPINPDIPAEAAPSPALYTPAPGDVPTSEASDYTTIIIVCVVSTALVAAVLIVLLRKKKAK